MVEPVPEEVCHLHVTSHGSVRSGWDTSGGVDGCVCESVLRYNSIHQFTGPVSRKSNIF